MDGWSIPRGRRNLRVWGFRFAGRRRRGSTKTAPNRGLRPKRRQIRSGHTNVRQVRKALSGRLKQPNCSL